MASMASTSTLLEVPDLALLLADSPACRDSGARCTALRVEGETAAGENYGSTFLKVQAVFEDDRGGEFKRAVVAKRLPPTEYLRKVFNVNVSFPKEVSIRRVRTRVENKIIFSDCSNVAQAFV